MGTLTITFLLLWLPCNEFSSRPPCLEIGKDSEAVPRVKELLGAKLAVTESYIRRSIIPTRTPYGFKIAEVEPGSPADRAGWKGGDILLTFDGKPVKRVAELSEWIESAKRGDRIAFEVSRRKARLMSFSRKPWERITGEIRPRDRFELTAYRIRKDKEVLPKVKNALGVRLSVGESYLRRSIISTSSPYGFKIAEVEPDSPADRAGWKKGDILLTFDGKPVKRVVELSKWIESGKHGDRIAFEVSRRNAKLLSLSRNPWYRISGEITLNIGRNHAEIIRPKN